MCKPPKPAAMNAFPQAGGVKNAAVPKAMNAAPINGTGRTEYEPPVTTPVP
jgi:hypothetical protein